MSTSFASDTGEVAILVRVFNTDHGDLPPDAARYFLEKDFPPSDLKKMDELARKARQGSLTADEQEEMEHYCHVGDLLAMMKSKARLALGHSQSEG
jgi:hypothetical protein